MKRFFFGWLIALQMLAFSTGCEYVCGDGSATQAPPSQAYTDSDGDGSSPMQGDCNDNNGTIHPGAYENPDDGIDNNCNTAVDERGDDDNDGDGFDASEDCNDCNSAVKPGGTEACNDGIDGNCNGTADEGCDSSAGYIPACRIVWRGATAPVVGDVRPFKITGGACEGGTPTETPTPTELTPSPTPTTPEQVTPTPSNPTDSPTPSEDTPCVDEDSDGFCGEIDCDDGNVAVNYNAAEICDGVDNNCDDRTDEGFDVDGDGHLSAELCPDLGVQLDCNDADGGIYPGKLEDPYDGIDQDCDGEDLTDVDGDGFEGTAVGGSDCDDRSPSINPNAPEVCDRKDQNCNSQIDEDFDNDGDGFYSKETCPAFGDDCNDVDPSINPNALETCEDGATDKNCDGSAGGDVDADGDGFVACEDCDDSRDWVKPGAPESCNFDDDDCDGETDEGVTTTSYRDTDGDQHGSPGNSYNGCGIPAGNVNVGDDCNDEVATIYPGAPEGCNGVDNDCDGAVPEEEDDSDEDEFRLCAGDCNDADPTVNPSVPEVCDGKDNDCDGKTDNYDDDTTGQTTWYLDSDRDGYGSTTAYLFCDPPNGHVDNADDCNDADPTVHPGVIETCNGVDDNCNSSIDEGVKTTFYFDGDADTWGGTTTIQACTAPNSYVATPGDCKDNNAAINPGATESICNGVDEDCDGLTDDHPDSDSDGYDACAIGVSGSDAKATDCNDTNPGIKPGATEICNGSDDDCDAVKDEGFDKDGDTFTSCAAPTADCNDNSPTVYPGAAESCNGADDNCNTTIDEGVKTTYYVDTDSDTYGTSVGSVQACTNPGGYVVRAGDCKDNNAAINPGATELCDNIDNDCDSVVDDNAVNNGVKFNTVSASYGVVGYDSSLRLEGDWMFTLEVTWSGSAGTLFMVNGYEGQTFELVDLGVNADGSVGGYYYHNGTSYHLVESVTPALEVGVPTTLQFGRIAGYLVLLKDGVEIDREAAPNPPVVVAADLYVGPFTGIGKTAPQNAVYDSFSLEVGGTTVLDLLFNEGTGTIARDSSGEGNDASLQNMGWVSLTCPTSP